MDNVHFSTDRDDWGTPQELFDMLDGEFCFTLDPCAGQPARDKRGIKRG